MTINTIDIKELTHQSPFTIHYSQKREKSNIN